MTTITLEKRKRWRERALLFGHVAGSPSYQIMQLLDALREAEARIEEFQGIRNRLDVLMDEAEARHLEDRHTLQALASEHAARAAELERQRDWLANILGLACRASDCPVKDESCPIPRRICGDVTTGDWANAAADELHGKTIGDFIVEAQEASGNE